MWKCQISAIISNSIVTKIIQNCHCVNTFVYPRFSFILIKETIKKCKKRPLDAPTTKFKMKQKRYRVICSIRARFLIEKLFVDVEQKNWTEYIRVVHNIVRVTFWDCRLKTLIFVNLFISHKQALNFGRVSKTKGLLYI